jgi:uncharacterized protein (UPF0147 family)
MKKDKLQERISMLLNLASVHESEEIRRKAALEIAQSYWEVFDKRFRTFGTNWEMINLFRDMTSVLMKSIESKIMPDEVSLEIGKGLVEKAEYDPDSYGLLSLQDIRENAGFPYPVKVDAELKIVGRIIDGNAYKKGYKDLLLIAEDETYSEEARIGAGEGLPIYVKEHAKRLLERHKAYGVIVLGERIRNPTMKEKIYDGYERKRAFEELIALLEDGLIQEDYRMEAGVIALEISCKYNTEEFCQTMLRSNKIPAQLREKAGMELVEYYIGCWDTKKLADLSSNRRISQKIRSTASENLQKVESQKWESLIWSHADRGEYREIDRIIADSEISEEERKYAMQNRNKSIRNHIEYSTREGKYCNLIRLSNDETIPDNLRKLARTNIEEAGRKAIGRSRGKELIKLAKDGQLPKTVRMKALDWALEELIQKDLVNYGHRSKYSALLEIISDNELRELNVKAIDAAVEKAGKKNIEKFLESQDAVNLKKMSVDEKIPENIREKAASALARLLSALESQLEKDGEMVDAPGFTKRPVKVKTIAESKKQKSK